MSVRHYYDLCCKSVGRAVDIRDIHGKCHRGIIENVDHEQVYLRPLDATVPPGGGPGGYGTFLWGPVAAGALWGVALGSIATLAFLPYPYYW